MPVCYNIPVSLLDSFRNEMVIPRSSEVSEILEAAQKIEPDNLCYLQLLSPQQDTSPFMKLKEPVLVDLVLDDPQEFSLLYKHVELFGKHPVRVTTAAAPGVTKTVRLAMSLGLPIKLEVTQPERPVVDELLELLDHYLHHTTVSQPIDFFHGLLMAAYLNNEATLWEIQEEDPEKFRFITDSGDSMISRRLPMTADPASPEKFLSDLKTKLLQHGECSDCLFFSNCCGYFKVPDSQYECNCVKELLSMIRNAAFELRKDYEKYLQAEGGPLT